MVGGTTLLDDVAPIAFAYFSWPPGTACAEALPDGFYSVVGRLEPTFEEKAVIIDAEGNEVLKVDMEREIMDEPPVPEGEDESIVDVYILDEDPTQRSTVLAKHEWAFPNHHAWVQVVITSEDGK